MTPEPKPQIVGGAPAQHWAVHMRERMKYALRQHAPANLVQALYASVNENQAQRVDYCGSLWAEYRNADGHYVWHLLRCRSRWCPYCGSVWQRTAIDLLEAAGIPDDTTTIMTTVTTGQRVAGVALRETVAELVKTWKRWRKWAANHGVRGGVYSLEIAPPAGDEDEDTFHPHLHATLVVDKSAPWLIANEKFMETHDPKNGQTTPALVWFARSWAYIMREYWPERYRCLKPVDDVLPSLARPWGSIAVECPERVAVCDIAGHWPDRKRKGKPLRRLRSGGTVRQDLEQSLKYISKPLGQEKEEKSAPVSPGAWNDIVFAMSGRRRAQAWGCWYGIKLKNDEDYDEKEDEDKIERTGYVAIWTTRRTLNISSLIGAFWYGYNCIDEYEQSSGFIIAHVTRLLEGG